MHLKKFLKDHKTEFLVVGGATVLVIGGIILCRKLKIPEKLKENATTKALEHICESIAINQTVDLPKPDWGKVFTVHEHWIDNTDGVNMMIMDTFAPWMGELGDKLINELNANPDVPVGIILSYCVG